MNRVEVQSDRRGFCVSEIFICRYFKRRIIKLKGSIHNGSGCLGEKTELGKVCQENTHTELLFLLAGIQGVKRLGVKRLVGTSAVDLRFCSHSSLKQ